MMKKFLYISLSISLCFIFLSNCSQQKAEKTYTFTFSIFFPPTHAQAKTAIAFAKEIEKRTNGKVQITTFPGGTLTKAPQVYEGVVKGISDIGLSCFAYTRGRFPVMAAIDLPMGYPNGKVASTVANEFAKTVNPKELHDVKILYIHAHGPGLLHTKKPVSTLKELKGMKIRATGLSAKIVQALGGVPVAMPQGGTYEALHKGVVEGTFGPIEVLKGWKQGEVIKNTTQCDNIGYTTSMFVIMNLKKWNSLPDNIKKIFEETSEEWVHKHGESWDKSDQEGKKFTLSLNNYIIKLDAAEKEKWHLAVQPVINDYISQSNGNKKRINTVRELIKKHSK